MQEHNITFSYQSISKAEILDTKIVEMLDTAIAYMDLAYAPYSNFQVGSAALTESGLIYGGSNQENASYPLTMCSERNAMYRAALSAPGDKVMAVAITARSKDGMLAKPVMPCGACRQVLLEFEERYERDLSIYVITADDTVYIMQRAKDLLPLSFDKSYL